MLLLATRVRCMDIVGESTNTIMCSSSVLRSLLVCDAMNTPPQSTKVNQALLLLLYCSRQYWVVREQPIKSQQLSSSSVEVQKPHTCNNHSLDHHRHTTTEAAHNITIKSSNNPPYHYYYYCIIISKLLLKLLLQPTIRQT